MSLRFYEDNAQSFFDQTVAVDMAELCDWFLSRVPNGGKLLDAGCGSGRDALYFKQLGYDVVATEPAPALARLAATLLNQPVLPLTFQEISFQDEFDGIWACASLLHVPKAEMGAVLDRLQQALKIGGTLYASFKLGNDEVQRGSRIFSNYDEPSFSALLAEVPDLELIDVRISQDARPGRQDERWLNVLVVKR